MTYFGSGMFVQWQEAANQPVALNILDNRHQQITEGRDELLVFGVEWVLPKIVVQVPDEMHQALLLPTCYRVVTAVEVRYQDSLVSI